MTIKHFNDLGWRVALGLAHTHTHIMKWPLFGCPYVRVLINPWTSAEEEEVWSCDEKKHRGSDDI